MTISCLVKMVNLFKVSKTRDICESARHQYPVILVWKFDLQDDYQQEDKFYCHWIFY